MYNLETSFRKEAISSGRSESHKVEFSQKGLRQGIKTWARSEKKTLSKNKVFA